ncbi:protein rep, partial [Massilia sp. SYSU DXS3249]
MKVKGVPLDEIITKRHEAATLGSIQAGNLALLEKREALRAERLRNQKILSTPELVRQTGLSSYVRRLEKTARGLDATHDDAQAAAGGVAGAALGNNTESQAVFRESIDENTGEIQRLRVVSRRGENVLETVSETGANNARGARFSAQTSAAKLLHDERTPKGSQWRVTGCTRRKIAADVSVFYSGKIKKAHFGGLMVCGSVWTCPPCAAKVSERRKQEIVSATDMHKAQGGGLYLVTFTTSHKRDDDLGRWLKKFAAAKVKMREWRAYKNLKIDTGYVGDIRALEVTYGDANGWHPHEHGLWLTAKPLSARKLEAMRAELFTLWRRACVAVGLPPPNRKRGVDVRFMESSAEYVAKFGREPRWGAGAELAKQHIKNGKVASMSPFDLLRRYHEGSDDASHKRFGALFVQFANAFFGKRQIIWSDGLKQLFGIEQKTDEELAVEEAEDAR